MFSSRKRLNARTTSKDLKRPEYLQALVSEFQDSDNKDAKEQVLANLANFAYDPINYEYLRDLHVTDMFVDCIETDENINGNIVEFGIGGLCNLAADLTNRQEILSNERAIDLIIRCLSSSTEETVLSAITCLMQLIVPESRHRIVTSSVIECMRQFAATSNVRLRNLAEIFLVDHCKEEERNTASNSTTFLHIPMPSDQ